MNLNYEINKFIKIIIVFFIMIILNTNINTVSAESNEYDSIIQWIVTNKLPNGNYTFKVQNETYTVELINYYDDVVYATNPVYLGDNTTQKKNLIVKYHGNLTIESGVTVSPTTVSNLTYKKGMFIYVAGTLTNKGSITMTARGTYNEPGQALYLWKNPNNSYELIPATGSAGGNSVYLRASIGTRGHGNPGGIGVSRGTGGGGSGGTISNSNNTYSGAGAAGTSYSGGTGGGGGYNGATAINGAINGGSGGAGRGNAVYTWSCGGGAGNPGGLGANGGAAGGNGTGGLLVIYATSFYNNGTITSNGSNGGTSYRTGGGGSGGGSVNIFYSLGFQRGTITANGGVGGTGTRGAESANGGNGGNGTVSVNQLIIDPKLLNPQLSTLTITPGILDSNFEPDKYLYNLTLTSEQSRIFIDVVAEDPESEILGDGYIDVLPGTNDYYVTVTSRIGISNIYKLTIYRPPSSYSLLENITINGEAINNFSPETLNYTIDVPFNYDVIELGALKARPSQIIEGIGQKNVKTGSNTYFIDVMSEDYTSSKTYKIIINRPASSKLKSLTVAGYQLMPNFDSNLYEYDISVAANTLSLDVTALAYDESASVTIEGNGYIKDAKGKIKITVNHNELESTIYIINVTKEGVPAITNYTYGCTNNYQQFTAPITGNYFVELWGAQGGTGSTNMSFKNRGGFGAYTSGYLFLSKDQVIYIYVGCAGAQASSLERFTGGLGGFNGGGKGGDDSNHDSAPDAGGGGGGATDIRLAPGVWNNFDSLKSRIMVAAGGGGGNYAGIGGAGGTLVGIRGINNGNNATQISGYAFGYGMPGGACTDGSGGAGGGYYGGYTGTGCSNGGGGGSSFVSGCIGCNAISEDSISTKIIHTNQPNHYSGYIFKDISMINGTESMPNPNGGYTVGKSGSGYAKITVMPPLSSNNFLSIIETSKGTLNPTFDLETLEYTVELGVNDTNIYIHALPEDGLANIAGNGNYKIKSGQNLIPITVTAENGETRVYTLNVIREASTEANPEDIIISGLVPSLCALNENYCKLSDEFDPDIDTYFITVPSRIKDLEFAVVKKHDYQTVVGEGVINLETEETLVTIEVTSEDGQNRKIYKFHIERDMNGNNDLDSLTIDNPEREINFDPGITEYFITIPNDYTSVSLTAIPSDPRVTPIISGNENLEVGINVITVFMKAYTGEEKYYVVNVYREQSGNTFLSNIEVKHGETLYPLTPIFNKILNNFTVTVPNEVDSIELVTTKEKATTNVIGNGVKTLIVGTNKFVIDTIAEDGSKGRYTINIIREKSKNADLIDLLIDTFSLDPEFNSNNKSYNLTVPSSIKSLNITPVLASPKATYTITGNSNFKAGNNIVKITVTAESGAKNEYIVNVNRLISDNNNLLSLNTNIIDMSLIFNKDILEYNLSVNSDVSSINISATKEDPLSKLSGVGLYNLKTGMNTINVEVISESGNLKTYVINIDKAPNNDNNLINITNDKGAILTPTFNKDTLNYTLNVQNEVNSIKIDAVLSAKTSTINGTGNYILKTGNNTIKLTITAEDGSIKIYEVNVVRDKSTNDDLKYLLIHEGAISPSFNETIIEYQVKIAHDVNVLTIDAITEDENATYEIIGNNNLQLGNNTVIVRVTAEAGEQYTKDYIINVIKQSPNINSNNLINITVNRGVMTPSFNANQLIYNVELDYDYSTITVSGTKEDLNATVTGFGTYNMSIGKNIIPIRVISSDGIERDYQLIVNRKKSNEARLSSLVIPTSNLSPNFSSNIYAYGLNTTNSIIDIAVKTIETEATYEIIGNNNLQIGTNIVIIRVTAPDKETTKDYVLTVTRTLSNNNNLASLEVIGTNINPSFNKTITLYNATVSNDINSIIVNATKEDEKATLEIDSEYMLLVGENIINITVISESGNIKVYTIIIKKDGSNDNKLLNLIVDYGTLNPVFNSNVNQYEVIVPYEKDSINIDATLSDVNAKVEGTGNHLLNVGENKIVIKVTAENGQVNNYQLTVKRNPIVSSKLKDINITNYKLNQNFDSDVLDYNVTIDNEITSLNINAITLDPYATYEIIGNNDFEIGMNTVDIVVTSSDGSATTSYRLNVNRQNQSNTYLAYISLSKGVLSPSFDKSKLTYNVNVPNDISSIMVGAEAEVSSSTVTGMGNYNLQPGHNLITLTVTSQTGIVRKYYINVIRDKSNDNFLTSLSIKKGSTVFSLDPVFNSNISNYVVNVPTGTDSVELFGTASLNAEVKGLGIKNLVIGNNSFEIEVISQSGISNVYHLVINRPPSNNNYLTMLTPSIGTLNPSFSYYETNYTLTVDSSASLLSFEYGKEDRYALVTGNERLAIPDGTSIRKIIVTAENGDKREYTITVIKDRTDEARLASLSVNGYSLNETFNSDTYVYTVTVPNSKKTISPSEINASAIDRNAVINKDALLVLNTENPNIYKINILAPDGFTVQTYEIHITREKGNDAKLASLKFKNGTLDKAFNPNITSYTLKVPNTIKDIVSADVEALANDASAKITKMAYLDLSSGGDKYYTITVVSDDESESITYTIKVEYLQSSDNRLSSITVSNSTLNPTFNPNTKNYTVSVDETLEKISIDASVLDEKSSIVSGLGEYSLDNNEKIITIVVKAEDDSITNYIIRVIKNKTSLLSLNNIIFNNYDSNLCGIENECKISPVFDSEITSYEIAFPHEINKVNLVISKMSDNQIVKVYNAATDQLITGATINLQIGDNNIRIEVENSYGVKKSYYVKVKRLKSSNTNLSTLLITNPSLNIDFETNQLEYFIEIANEFEEILLSATPEDTNAVVTIKNNRYLREGNNDVIITVTAPSGATKDYIIHVHRRPLYNNYLKTITVSSGVIYNLQPSFNKTNYTYTTTVPNSVTKVTVEGVVDDITTTVLGNVERDIVVGVNQFTLTTIAATGETATYIVTVIREKAENVFLKSLNVLEGNLNEPFVRDKTTYTMTIPSTISNLNVIAIPEVASATVKIVGNTDLKTGRNTINIVVFSSDKTTSRTYFLVVNKLQSSNNLLKAINVSAGTLNPIFNSNINEYNFRVSTKTSSIEIEGIRTDSLAFVNGNGTYSLVYGDNQVILEVYAENGSRNIYILNIYREYNNYLYDLEISKGELNPTFDRNITSYQVNVDSKTTDITINGIKEEVTSTITGNGTYSLQPGENIFNITVSSVDETSKTYTIIVNRQSSSNNYIKTLIIREGIINPIFNKDITEYEIMISNEHKNGTFEIELEDSKARYEIIGNENLILGDNEVIVRVTAENGDIKEYKINIIKQPAELFSNKLSSLKVDKGSLSPSFKSDMYSYIVTVGNDVEDITVTAIKESVDSKITGTGKHSLNYGRNRIMIAITSKDGIIRYYELIVNRTLSSDARLMDLSFNEGEILPIFSRNNRNYTINVDSSVNKLMPTIVPVITGTTYQVVGNENLQIGENIVKILTTAQNGISKMEYTIKVNKMLSMKNRLLTLTSNFGVLEPAFDKDNGGPYIINVENNINSIILSGVLEDSTSQVIGLGLHQLKGATTTIHIVVTSDAGLVKTYTVIVNKEVIDDPTLSLLQVDTGILNPIFNPHTYDYEVEVPYETGFIRLTALAAKSDSKVTGEGEYNLLVGDNWIEVKVESIMETTRTYKIKVKRLSIISSKLSLLKIKEGIISPGFMKDITNYEVYVPSEIENIEPEVILEDVYGTYEITGNNNLKIGSNNVKIQVTSSDELETTTYEINVVRQINSNNFLTYLATSIGTITPSFNKTILNYEVNIPNEIDQITIYGGAEDGKASVSGLGTYYNLETGDNLIPITVRSQTGIVRTYFVNVKRALSDNNLLSELTINSGTLSPEFNPTINNYNIEVDSGVNSITINGKNNYNATILGIGDIILTNQVTEIVITVTSESGLVNNYYVTINRNLSSEADIIDIIPSSSELNQEYNPTIDYYEIIVNDEVNKIDFNVILSNNKANVTGNNNILLNYGENIIKIIVTAENNITTKEVTIKVTRKKALQNVILNKTTLILAPNEEEEITLNYLPEDADNKEFSWVSLDSNVVTVTNGLIKAKNPGSTIIELTNIENPIIKRQILVNVIPLKITSEEYEIRRSEDSDDIVIGIKDRVKLSEFIEKFDNEPEQLKVYDVNNNLIEDMNTRIGTGMVIKLVVGNVIYDSLVIIIRGDINGDGLIDISDVAITEDHVIFKDIKTGYVLHAMDVIDYGNIDISDVSRIEDYVIFKIDTLN